ncbi:MAG: outer membrane protein assembly factor BamD, partial [Nitrospirae bacterium]|nr:outer membrane protein assembly factor BamD [Nitrospirota bacterium]
MKKIFNDNRMLKNILLALVILPLCIACSSDKAELKKTPALEAEAYFTKANDKIKSGYYEEAREILQSIKTHDASGQYSALAQVRIGDTYFEDKMYDEAVVEYREFLKMHPYNKYASYAQYQTAMCYF